MVQTYEGVVAWQQVFANALRGEVELAKHVAKQAGAGLGEHIFVYPGFLGSWAKVYIRRASRVNYAPTDELQTGTRKPYDNCERWRDSCLWIHIHC
jgi:hypothetical protein